MKSGQQGTNKPWERPDQFSQNPDAKVPTKKDRSALKKIRDFLMFLFFSNRMGVIGSLAVTIVVSLVLLKACGMV